MRVGFYLTPVQGGYLADFKKTLNLPSEVHTVWSDHYQSRQRRLGRRFWLHNFLTFRFRRSNIRTSSGSYRESSGGRWQHPKCHKASTLSSVMATKKKLRESSALGPSAVSKAPNC